ncbi:MAG: bifunctional oligoribonuclease/PAP phosphatase NrnA [Candidatus Omnitrophica bacterium]|nr:bifunctional oligoribonuclease/PAP phosphatase NrnA [Candidatus Omnitrophota bacterium]
MKNILKIIQTLKKNKTFLVTTHVNPDADGLCSQLAVAHYIRSLGGKKVYLINEESAPKRFDFIKGITQIKSVTEVKNLHYDVALVLDCGELSRIGKVKSVFDKNKPVINIDHHITNNRFGQINWVDDQASSTTEMIFLLLEEARSVITKDIALYLYAGMMTDTGSFRFENTTSRTHEIIARLMYFDIPVVELYKKFYEDIPSQDLKMLTKILNKFDLLFDGQVVCMVLGKAILSKVSADFDLREAIFKFLRNMKGAKIFVIFTEVSSQKTRVNFRSVATVDVSALAGHFGGGGHKQASGCTINKPIRQAKALVLNYLKKAL